MTIGAEQKARAYQVLRAAGFTSGETRELLAGPKTLRDEFAMAMLQGAAVHPKTLIDQDGDFIGGKRMAAAYHMADEAMRIRSRGPITPEGGT